MFVYTIQLDNRFDCIVYTNIYPVVKPFSQPVWEQVVSCKRGLSTTTYGLFDGRSVITCSSVIRAAVVEPVGRKAYWSQKLGDRGGTRNAG